MSLPTRQTIQLSRPRLVALAREVGPTAKPEHAVDLRSFAHGRECAVEAICKALLWTANLAPETRRIAFLSVGESFISSVPASNVSTLHSRIKTARKALGEPDAKWSIKTMSDGRIRVRREPDDWRHSTVERAGEGIHILTQMAVGETIMGPRVHFTNINAGLATARKKRARRIMDAPDADWSGVTTTKGIRITRTK